MLQHLQLNHVVDDSSFKGFYAVADGRCGEVGYLSVYPADDGQVIEGSGTARALPQDHSRFSLAITGQVTREHETLFQARRRSRSAALRIWFSFPAPTFQVNRLFIGDTVSDIRRLSP